MNAIVLEVCLLCMHKSYATEMIRFTCNRDNIFLYLDLYVAICIIYKNVSKSLEVKQSFEIWSYF